MQWKPILAWAGAIPLTRIAAWLSARRFLLVLWALLCATPARARYQGELHIELDTRAGSLPDTVCLWGGQGVLFGAPTTCSSEHGQNPSEAAPSHGQPSVLVLKLKADFGPSVSQSLSAQVISYSSGHLALAYWGERRPEVITVGSPQPEKADARCPSGAEYHSVQEVTWLPMFGTRPISVSVVPCTVQIQVAFPEYECLYGQKASSDRPVDIDREWRIKDDGAVPGCQAPEGADDGLRQRSSESATFQFITGVSIRTLQEVPVVATGMRIAWRPDPLSEAPLKDGAVQVEADRALPCDPATWSEEHQRFEWLCGEHSKAVTRLPGGKAGRIEFPVVLQLRAVYCGKDAQCPRWTEHLRYPGQTLTGYVESDARTILLHWIGWCDDDIGRAQWKMDAIGSVELQTVHGVNLTLTLPDCKSGAPDERYWQRVPLPGLQPNEPLRVRFDGDRMFAPLVAHVGTCGRMIETEMIVVHNCLGLRPPDEAQLPEEANLRRDRATMGVSMLGGLYHASTSSPDFYGPLGELHVNVLWRGIPWSRRYRWDLDVSGLLSFQSWSAYRCRSSCSPSSSGADSAEYEHFERQRDELVGFGLQPTLRVAFWKDLFFGVHALLRYAAPLTRKGSSEQVPLHWGLGVGWTTTWYLSRAVALDVQERWTFARTRFVAFDPSGIVSSSAEATRQWCMLFGIRFDDLAGD
jgi:hypothetical protein